MTLLFRAISLDDAPLLQQLYSDPRMTQFIAPTTSTDTSSLLHQMIDAMAAPQPTFCYWVIVLPNQHSAVGLVSATQLNWQQHRAELGIMLLPSSQARGVAKQAFLQLIAMLQQQGFRQLYSRMAFANYAARRLVRQCGMRPCQAPTYAKSAETMYWVQL